MSSDMFGTSSSPSVIEIDKGNEIRDFTEVSQNVSLESSLNLGASSRFASPIAPQLKSPPSSLATYIKSARFMPSSVQRPKLFTDINIRLESELRKLSSSNANSIQSLILRWEVFQKAFQAYIDDTSVYKPLLEKVKGEYEDLIKALKEKADFCVNFEESMKRKDELHQSEILETKAKTDKIENALNRKIKTLEEGLIKMQRENYRGEMELSKKAADYKQLQTEYDNLHSTSIALASSLTKTEEQIWKIQLKLNAKEAEANEQRNTAIKLADEMSKIDFSMQVCCLL